VALMIVRKSSDLVLNLRDPDAGLFPRNHILEPEYHQERYVSASRAIQKLRGSFRVGDLSLLQREPFRGVQPVYADDETDPASLAWEGMIQSDGTPLSGSNLNICALKSNCVRFGYVDTSLARSVTRDFYAAKRNRSAVEKHDVLINSTGDGTLGRVAVFGYDFPAVVDGHITILRYNDPDVAWYVAAFLLSTEGQRQIYRYINGSSGQVEIYPQDIERIWVRPAPAARMRAVASAFQNACRKHDEFFRDIRAALNLI